MRAKWIRPLAEADASCGAKAAGLARLIAAGLPVPDGFVIDRDGFAAVAALAEVAPDASDAIGHALDAAAERIASAAVPAEVEAEVRRRAEALGRLAVRSSASIEDGAGGAGAGVFASVTDVAPADVWGAVREVWTSALTELAMAYARRRGQAIAISVIVQRFVPGERLTVYTRPAAGDADELWVQREPGAVERVPRSAVASRPELVIALAAEDAIGATAGADVELIAAPGGPQLVQARPMIAPVIRTRQPPPPIVLAALVADGRRWTWDITHNPDPLSPAQAGLVERVDRAEASTYAMRVCGGYLYTSPLPAESVGAPADRAELAQRIAAIEARLVLGEPVSVAEAVDRYVAFMAIWARELSPLVAAARRPLLDRLARDGQLPERIPAVAASLLGPRRVLRDQVMAPAWDVCVPTFAERASGAPSPEQDARAKPATSDAPSVPPELAAAIDLARAAADASEADDLWFARAQWMVRNALLVHAAAHDFVGDDVFWLPLDDVITGRTGDRDDVHRRAAAARAAHGRAAEWDMPLVVHGSAPAAETEAAEPRTVLHGVGIGPTVVGRVVRVASLATASALESTAPARRGDILVARAITPALAMLAAGYAALVSETGGLLDHGAALARELGIPCVVGCAGAWSQLTDGMIIRVDGDAGTVTTRAATAS